MTSAEGKDHSQRHSGIWRSNRSIEEITANGKALFELFNKLKSKDFEAYIRAKYNVGPRKAQDWFHVVRRFGDCPDLVRDLPETVIIFLARSPLDDQTIELFISYIRSGKIKSN